MSFKAFADKAAALDAAEAVGRLYAASVGKPWPMPPDAYGPGRQPQPPAAYYQRYWVAALDPVTAGGPFNNPKDLPDRIEVDSFTAAQDGKAVIITGAKQVTLDFKGLQT